MQDRLCLNSWRAAWLDSILSITDVLNRCCHAGVTTYIIFLNRVSSIMYPHASWMSVAASRSANGQTESFILFKVYIWELFWHPIVTSHITGDILLCQRVNEMNIVIFVIKNSPYRAEVNRAPWWVLILTRLHSLEPRQLANQWTVPPWSTVQSAKSISHIAIQSTNRTSYTTLHHLNVICGSPWFFNSF